MTLVINMLMSYRLSLNHLLFSGKRLVRCFIATALACQLVTNTAMAESSGRGANVTTVHEPTTRLDTPLREKTAPRVVSPKRLVADGALVGHGGQASTLADNNLAASAATERGIEAAESCGSVLERSLARAAFPLQLPN